MKFRILYVKEENDLRRHKDEKEATSFDIIMDNLVLYGDGGVLIAAYKRNQWIKIEKIE